jgi:predicted phage terminase large subunit-like protein
MAGYLPHYLSALPAAFHAELGRLALDAALCRGEFALHRGLVVAAPRSSAKSSILSLALVLYLAVYQYKRFIVLFSDSDVPQARTLAQHIKEEIETNQRLREDFGRLVGERWTGQDFEIAHRNVDGQVTFRTRILSRGVQGRLRGLRSGAQRPSLIILDDAENDLMVRTAEQREQLWLWFGKAVTPMPDAERGRLIVAGTILHQDSLLARLLEKVAEPGSQYIGRKWQAIQPDGSALWPDLWPLDRLEQVRRDNPMTFGSEFMNDPVDEEARVVRPEWLNWYTSDDLWRQDDGRWYWRGQRLTLYAFVDPAISEREWADETAIIVGGVSPDRKKLFILHAFHARLGFERQVEQCINVFNYYRPRRFGFESQVYQAALHQEVRRQLRIKAAIVPVQRRGRKADRLRALSPLFADGWVYLRAAAEAEGGELDLTGHVRVHHTAADYYHALVYYPNTKHDDMFDATEGLLTIALKQPLFAEGTWIM